MKNSNIIQLKSKFFITRLLTYFSFLLIPVWIPRILEINQGFQALTIVLYILFMASQWYLLGKEVDHRLKIYFRVNSSMDRVVYRLTMGKILMLILFSLYSLIPFEIVNHFFWGTWVVMGLFYSWPTRGKIIKETVSSQLNEFHFLDSFEKTILGLISVLILVSIPEIPKFESVAGLKTFFNPDLKIHPQMWAFLRINYFPFMKYPQLFKLSWCLHFYFVGMGMFLLTFYALLRFFVSRRLSILGVFAVISTWSFSKILEADLGASLTTTYSIIWVWTFLWITKSGTYRAGLFLGLIGYWGVIINVSYIFLIPIQLLILLLFFMKDKSKWYKRQILKYSYLGIILTVLAFVFNYDHFGDLFTFEYFDYYKMFKTYINRKAFFVLSFFGVSLLIMKYFIKNNEALKQLHLDKEKLLQMVMAYAVLMVFAFIFEPKAIQKFSMIWMISFFSLIPLEWVFQAITRLRSRRNMIFAIYILICLLDSHFEGRVKTLIQLFQ